MKCYICWWTLADNSFLYLRLPPPNQPDLVFWSTSLKTAYIIELTVPWENSVEEAYVRKQSAMQSLHQKQRSVATTRKSIQLKCRGIVVLSTIRLLKELGIHGQALWNTIRSVSEEADKSSWWIWLKRKDPCWAPNASGWSLGTVDTGYMLRADHPAAGCPCGGCIVWNAETPSDARIHYWWCVLYPFKQWDLEWLHILVRSLGISTHRSIKSDLPLT